MRFAMPGSRWPRCPVISCSSRGQHRGPTLGPRAPCCTRRERAGVLEITGQAAPFPCLEGESVCASLLLPHFPPANRPPSWKHATRVHLQVGSEMARNGWASPSWCRPAVPMPMHALPSRDTFS
ncbi:hypothetical protein VTK73DRAFT_3581 [Phialemonium thermophilum]|uniref:Uncharacterized protein n=1 Tax=Phialemonium thermophilum TaxID=223376 RepID=A0ABR3VH74_9PEZI